MTESPTALASEIELIFNRSSKGVRNAVEGILVALFDQCLERGASVVGHIKCFVEGERGDFLFGSITSLTEGAHLEGSLRTAKHAKVVFNIIVFGIESQVLEGVFQKVLGEQSRMGNFSFRVLKKKPSCT